MELVLLASRTALGIVLLVAGTFKLWDRPAFADAVAGYRLLPPALARPAAFVLPWLEMGLGLVLVLGAATLPAAVAAAVLLTAFAVAMGANLARGRVIGCGCLGGSRDSPISWAKVARAAGLAAVAVVLALRPPPSLTSMLRARTADTLASLLVVLMLFAALRLLVQALGFRAAVGSSTLMALEGSS